MKIPLLMRTIKPTNRVRAVLNNNRDEILTIDTENPDDLFLVMELGKWADGISRECQRILQRRRLEDESRKQ